MKTFKSTSTIKREFVCAPIGARSPLLLFKMSRATQIKTGRGALETLPTKSHEGILFNDYLQTAQKNWLEHGRSTGNHLGMSAKDDLRSVSAFAALLREDAIEKFFAQNRVGQYNIIIRQIAGYVSHTPFTDILADKKAVKRIVVIENFGKNVTRVTAGEIWNAFGKPTTESIASGMK